MATNYPTEYKIPEKPKVGALSGWNKITTNKGDETKPQGDHEFTIPDLLRIVKAMRAEFNISRIGEIEELIRKHMARKDNPHQLDLSKLNTSVLQELYLVWLDRGNQGKTREEFLKVLFQYVKVADISTTLKGEAYDETVTALGLATVMERHNNDTHAHDALFEYLFPGNPVEANPSFAIDGIVDFPEDAQVIRNSTMTVYLPSGLIKEVPANTMAVDFSTGTLAFPIFGATTNHIEESENFARANTWECSYSKLEQSTGILSPRDYNTGAWVLKEISNPGKPVCHQIQYIRETWDVIKGQYYTISLFVSPAGRNCLGIEVGDVIDANGRFGYKDSLLRPFDQGTFLGSTMNENNYRNVHYNLETGEIFINSHSEDLRGYIYPLYNGWYRVQYTFKALTSMPLQFRIYSLDIVDGDTTSEGINGAGIALFGITATEGPTLPPYIPSLNGVKGQLATTSVIIPIGDWYRREAGSIVTRFNNNGLDCRLKTTSEIYNIGNGSNGISLLARMPIGHNNRVFAAGYSTSSALAMSQYTKPSKEEWLDLMHCYSYSKYIIGGPENDTYVITTNRKVNDNVANLYIGCDRYLGSQLNGFLQRFYYYPEVLKPGNINFFTGRV